MLQSKTNEAGLKNLGSKKKKSFKQTSGNVCACTCATEQCSNMQVYEARRPCTKCHMQTSQNATCTWPTICAKATSVAACSGRSGCKWSFASHSVVTDKMTLKPPIRAQCIVYYR